MASEHVHVVGDGRGARRILVDGREVRRIVKADEQRGSVLQHVGFSRRRGVVLLRSIRGTVRVEYLNGE